MNHGASVATAKDIIFSVFFASLWFMAWFSLVKVADCKFDPDELFV